MPVRCDGSVAINPAARSRGKDNSNIQPYERSKEDVMDESKTDQKERKPAID
jgi:hypothetical protein